MFLNDGTRIFAKLRGEKIGKPVAVLMHGDGQNHTVWTGFADYIMQKGHSVLVYDLPGHGLSEPYKNGEYSFPRFVETLEEILAFYSIDTPLLVGNSSGGMIALSYAAKRQASGVIAISASDISPTKHNQSIEKVIEKYIEKSKELFQGQRLFRYDTTRIDDESMASACLKYTSPEAIQGNMGALKTFDIRDELNKIRCPVLAINGMQDIFVPEEYRERVRRKIRKSRAVTLKQFGHHILLEARELVLQALEENYSFLVQ